MGGRPLPLIGRARCYVCGITPYDVTHLGHAATFVWADTLVRVLRRLGFDVVLCRNVTDVDDVLTAAAARVGTPYDELAAIEQFDFERSMHALGVARPTYQPRAHQHVTDVVALAAALLRRGRAYERAGSVYFRGAGVAEHAGLTTAEAVALLAEHADDPHDPAKEHPTDVAVWRASSPGEPRWPSPWGAGRPGWHAECAAMALALLGPALDIHGGGGDLWFPHHAYEEAMAQAVTGVTPYARAWFRVGVVEHQGAKMAKSTGNLVLVEDVLASHEPAALRLLLLDRPWRAAWSYEPAALDAAAGRLERLWGAAGRPGGDREVAAVLSALADDLDVPAALAVAEDEGGRAARTALSVLALDASTG